jgi:hypothetical protein
MTPGRAGWTSGGRGVAGEEPRATTSTVVTAWGGATGGAVPEARGSGGRGATAVRWAEAWRVAGAGALDI